MPDKNRKRVPDHRSNVLKGFLPEGPFLPILGTRKMRVSDAERREREGEDREMK